MAKILRKRTATCAIAALVTMIATAASSEFASSQGPRHGGPGSNYHGRGHGQRGDHFRPYYGQKRRQYEPAYSGGWFQRPYPFHLDYYRMKYNGSYEPYFGNLYGPPLYNFFYPDPIRQYGGAYYW